MPSPSSNLYSMLLYSKFLLFTISMHFLTTFYHIAQSERFLQILNALVMPITNLYKSLGLLSVQVAKMLLNPANLFCNFRCGSFVVNVHRPAIGHPIPFKPRLASLHGTTSPPCQFVLCWCWKTYKLMVPFHASTFLRICFSSKESHFFFKHEVYFDTQLLDVPLLSSVMEHREAGCRSNGTLRSWVSK